MPKKEIATALAELADTCRCKADGKEGVWVPCGRKAPSWNPPRSKKGGRWLPFELLHDVMRFSLDNAITKLGDRLLLQDKGGPMGDPTSPGMTIGTCALMWNSDGCER
jgi:hypothetical protein